MFKIELEDLFLRELALDAEREDPLLELRDEPVEARVSPARVNTSSVRGTCCVIVLPPTLRPDAYLVR